MILAFSGDTASRVLFPLPFCDANVYWWRNLLKWFEWHAVLNILTGMLAEMAELIRHYKNTPQNVLLESNTKCKEHPCLNCMQFTPYPRASSTWYFSNFSVSAVLNHGRNWVVKCGGTAWCETNIVIGSMQKWSFINTDSHLFSEVFWKQH